MQVHQFVIDSLPNTPWKNGRGMTREIAVWPAASDLVSFRWRASIATIASSAPFSTFAGVDRTIMLLSGPGVHLRSKDGTINHRLDSAWRPFSFSGDVVVDCESLGGESSDFNVMTRRGVYRSVTAVLDRSASLEPASCGLFLGLRETWRVTAGSSSYRVQPGEGLWWEAGETSTWSLSPDGSMGRDAPALLAVRWTNVPRCEPESDQRS